jgi:hypothetical protein
MRLERERERKVLGASMRHGILAREARRTARSVSERRLRAGNRQSALDAHRYRTGSSYAGMVVALFHAPGPRGRQLVVLDGPPPRLQYCLCLCVCLRPPVPGRMGPALS